MGVLDQLVPTKTPFSPQNVDPRLSSKNIRGKALSPNANAAEDDDDDDDGAAVSRSTRAPTAPAAGPTRTYMSGKYRRYAELIIIY